MLLALAPVPVAVGRLLLADRGATPWTASVVAVAAAATVGCLVAAATTARGAARATAAPVAGPVRDGSARHLARGSNRRVALLPRQAKRRAG